MSVRKVTTLQVWAQAGNSKQVLIHNGKTGCTKWTRVECEVAKKG